MCSVTILLPAKARTIYMLLYRCWRIVFKNVFMLSMYTLDVDTLNTCESNRFNGGDETIVTSTRSSYYPQLLDKRVWSRLLITDHQLISLDIEPDLF